MAEKSNASKAIGPIIGLAAVAVAVYSVFFIDWKPEPVAEAPIVRPLKTMVIQSAVAAGARRYPGKVQANEQVDLALQVSGQLIELPIRKGLQVEEGQLLARIDPRDYENALSARQAQLDRTKAEYERISSLAERDMASEKEIFESKAAYDAAVAEANIARKALDDTSLFAPFAGVIANTFVDNFQNVSAKQPILSLQEVKSVEIVVNVPEARVVQGKGDLARIRFVATFEYLPDREFDVEVKEFSTEADPLTQTYAATFVMPAPQDVAILPGMTATIREYAEKGPEGEGVAFAVPVTAVPIDGQGQYYVWRLTDGPDQTATVHRTDVQVGEMVQDDILVLAGLESGDRIALAGVHLLQDGQRVRPFEAERE